MEIISVPFALLHLWGGKSEHEVDKEVRADFKVYRCLCADVQIPPQWEAGRSILFLVIKNISSLIIMTHYAEYFEMLMAFDLLQDKSFVQLELSFSHQVLGFLVELLCTLGGPQWENISLSPSLSLLYSGPLTHSVLFYSLQLRHSLNWGKICKIIF